MDKILFVNACVRRESRTLRLAQCVMEKLEGDVFERKLINETVTALDERLLQKRERLLRKKALSDDIFLYAREFAAADIIVMAAPYWDLTFPALLKMYLEQVTICGVTFQYTPEGIPQGLCRAKQLIYVTTAGGSIHFNFGYDYVKALSEQFYGIKEVHFFKAENLDIVGNDAEAICEAAIKKIQEKGMNESAAALTEDGKLPNLNSME